MGEQREQERLREQAKEESARRDRQDWFARELGERWQPDGDGVYRLVEVEPPEPGSDSKAEGGPDPEERSEEAADEYVPGWGGPAPLPPRPKRGHWWKRH